MRRIVDFVVILLCFSKGLTDTPTRVLYNVTEWIGRSIVGVVPDPERTIQCYGPYGCYSIDPPWTSAIRPIGVFPKPPNQIAPSFCFRSKKNPNLCLNISKPQQISYTDYNGQKPTVIITHGYMENGRQAWLQDMATTLMLYYDANVIVLDWVSGSAPPYTQAVANIRLIGTMVAQFIVEVSEKYGPSTREFHFIGHSLGAHLGGYAGSTLKRFGFTLGRVTGLDPAEPFFEGTETIVRLDPSDADFVDVIHTDGKPILAGGLGLIQPSGHVDFYPNGGMKQPGCGGDITESIDMEDGSIVYGIRRYIGCNHIKANEFFTESIKRDHCPFLAVECPSWEDFQSGKCSCGSGAIRCHVMGMHSRQDYVRKFPVGTQQPVPRSISAYLLTGSEKPFCRYHYRITLFISDTDESISHGADYGFLYLALGDALRTSQPIKLNKKKIKFEPGASYSFMTDLPQPSKITVAILEWRHWRNLFNPFTWRILSQPGLFVNRIDIESLETGERFTLCGNDIMLTSGVRTVLTEDSECRIQTQYTQGSLGYRKLKNRLSIFSRFS
ncbi:pancreatic triacylglycerol lipase-like isoform X2 [Artemia franciscana]|uniref:pancreatic triacylglycerol lipase-like isoform X2 n=1 Tax=Artemia franciscana TaxID=6661 RepID=UPI0032D9E4CC